MTTLFPCVLVKMSCSPSGKPQGTHHMYGAKNSLLVQIMFQLSLTVLLIPLRKASVTTQLKSLPSPRKSSQYLYLVSGAVVQRSCGLKLRLMLPSPTERPGRDGHIIPTATSLSSHWKEHDAGGGVHSSSVLVCFWLSFHTFSFHFIHPCRLPFP